MKKLLIIILLLSSFIAISGQNNAISIAVQPADYGVGLKYDHLFKYTGIYTSVTYGNWGIYKDNNLNHHIKITTGLSVPLKDYKECRYSLIGGLNYHYFQYDQYVDSPLDSKTFKPWSFELGLSTYSKHLALGIRTDILRWEPCIDIGFVF